MSVRRRLRRLEQGVTPAPSQDSALAEEIRALNREIAELDREVEEDGRRVEGEEFWASLEGLSLDEKIAALGAEVDES